jgi:hypothetical protein
MAGKTGGPLGHYIVEDACHRSSSMVLGELNELVRRPLTHLPKVWRKIIETESFVKFRDD